MDADRQMLVHKIERCEALVLQERARADSVEAKLREQLILCMLDRKKERDENRLLLSDLAAAREEIEQLKGVINTAPWIGTWKETEAERDAAEAKHGALVTTFNVLKNEWNARAKKAEAERDTLRAALTDAGRCNCHGLFDCELEENCPECAYTRKEARRALENINKKS